MKTELLNLTSKIIEQREGRLLSIYLVSS